MNQHHLIRGEQMSVLKKLMEIQNELEVPKTRDNDFGNFKYRNAEDILNAVKPIAKKHMALITVSDTVKRLGDRYFIEATATIYCAETGDSHSVTASAREPLSHAKMNESQTTGATSSYARKYALNGLLALDDDADADATPLAKRNSQQGRSPQGEQVAKISHAQAKRMLAIAKGNVEIIKQIIKIYGYEKSEEIKRSDYQAICEQIEAEVNLSRAGS